VRPTISPSRSDVERALELRQRFVVASGLLERGAEHVVQRRRFLIVGAVDLHAERDGAAVCVDRVRKIVRAARGVALHLERLVEQRIIGRRAGRECDRLVRIAFESLHVVALERDPARGVERSRELVRGRARHRAKARDGIVRELLRFRVIADRSELGRPEALVGDGEHRILASRFQRFECRCVERRGFLVLIELEIDPAERDLELGLEARLIVRNLVEPLHAEVHGVAERHRLAERRVRIGLLEKTEHEILHRGARLRCVQRRFGCDLALTRFEPERRRADHDREHGRDRQPVAAHELAQAIRARAAAQCAMVEIREEIVRQRTDARVTRFGRFRERALHDVLEIAAQRAPQRVGGHAASCCDGRCIDGFGVRALERAIERFGRLFDDGLRPADLAELGTPVRHPPDE
jgi:hypothetical protein